MAASNVKVQEIARELKVPAKEIIEKLSNFGITLKSGASLLEEEHLSLILEIYTQEYDMGSEPIVKPKVKEKPAAKETEKPTAAEAKAEEKPHTEESTAKTKPQPKKAHEQKQQPKPA